MTSQNASIAYGQLHRAATASLPVPMRQPQVPLDWGAHSAAIGAGLDRTKRRLVEGTRSIYDKAGQEFTRYADRLGPGVGLTLSTATRE